MMLRDVCRLISLKGNRLADIGAAEVVVRRASHQAIMERVRYYSAKVITNVIRFAGN